MATYTSNLNLKKPALDDDALITDINNNMDILDAAANGIQDAMAIVANGNTHVAITSGQFVYVRNHSTLTEGLYVASSNIAANATLSSSNLTADSKGGLNALSEQIGNSNIKQDTVSDLNNAFIQDGFKFFTYLNTASNKPGTAGGAGICFANGGYAVQIVFANRGADENLIYLRNAWGLGTSSVSWGTWKMISVS